MPIGLAGFSRDEDNSIILSHASYPCQVPETTSLPSHITGSELLRSNYPAGRECTILVEPTEIVRNAQAGAFAVGFSPDSSKYDMEELLALPVPRSLGSAFAIAEDEFLTCSHLFEATKGIQGTHRLIGTQKYQAGFIVYEVLDIVQDDELDFALMRAKPVRGIAVPLELEFSRPEVGHPILALGYPLPQETRRVVEPESGVRVGWFRIGITFRATSGIVSSWTDNGRRFEIDAQFSPGISGGPVVSALNGKVLGIAQGYLRLDDSFQPVISRCLMAASTQQKLADWRR